MYSTGNVKKRAVQFALLSVLLGSSAARAHAEPQHNFNVRHQRETAPSIATEPAGNTVTVGQTATFSVSAAGTAPLILSVAKERSDNQWSDVIRLYDAGDEDFRQRGEVHRSCSQQRRERDE